MTTSKRTIAREKVDFEEKDWHLSIGAHGRRDIWETSEDSEIWRASNVELVEVPTGIATRHNSNRLSWAAGFN
jgi:hypothetical protein